MAQLEHRQLLPRTNLANNAGTYQFTLPRSLSISSLFIEVEWTNGATSNRGQDCYDIISKLEIIANGNRVLYSLNGLQALKWTHTFMRQRPPYVRDANLSVAQKAVILIPFGMHPYDKSHYLDTTQFNDLQLRLTYAPTIAATSFATGTGYVTILADVWTEGQPGTFEGFLRLTEQYSFSSAASGDTQIELPLGNPYLAVGIYNFETGVAPATDITTIKLDLNDDSRIPAYGIWNELNQKFTGMLGIDATEWGYDMLADTNTHETRVGDVSSVFYNVIQTLTIGTTDQIITLPNTIAGGTVTVQSLARDAAAVAADAANATATLTHWVAKPKYGLGNFIPLSFGYPMYPEFAINSNNVNRARLTLTNGGAGADVRVSLLELVRS